MIGLTAKQRELYQFIAATIAESGIAPTFKEMAYALGFKSKARIHVLLNDLESKGALRRLPHQTRAIELIPQGDAVELRPEVRTAAVEYARRTNTSLAVVIAESVAAYVGRGGE